MNNMKPFLLAVITATLAVTGCESNSYTQAIKYVVRIDPLVKDKNLGDERIEPDRPGVLPILSSKSLENPFNPMFPKRETLFLEKNLLDPTLINKSDRLLLNAILTDLFGTPANPIVRVRSDIVAELKLQEENLERGSSLYRIHCLHCHGVTGDGRGPTGRWVNPHPRDYRQGLFKFMSVNQTAGPKPPRRDDIYRVLHQGIEGTAMPAFGLLPTADLEDLVSYVIHLSIRGKTEFEAIANGFEFEKVENKNAISAQGDYTIKVTMKGPPDSEPLDELVFKYLDNIAKSWVDSQSKDNAIVVGPYPYDDRDPVKLKNSIWRGFRLFKGEGSDKPGEAEVSKEEAKAANCISCHTSYGRQSLFKFDEWGTLTKPRDLTQGVFRGGRRPVDVYYRIHSGISGSGMTSAGAVIPKTENIWDLVNFVKTIPYPEMRKNLGIVLD